MRRAAVDQKRGITAAAADVHSRRQLVADTLQQLRLREQRLQHAELCVSVSYIFVMDLLQVLPLYQLPQLAARKCWTGAYVQLHAEARAAGADGGGDKCRDFSRGAARAHCAVGDGCNCSLPRSSASQFSS
jgi:hypothetical protein